MKNVHVIRLIPCVVGSVAAVGVWLVLDWIFFSGALALMALAMTIPLILVNFAIGTWIEPWALKRKERKKIHEEMS